MSDSVLENKGVNSNTATLLDQLFVGQLRHQYQVQLEKNRHYSVRRFAQQLQTDPSNLHKILKGQCFPKEKSQKRLMELLEVSQLDYFLLTDPSKKREFQESTMSYSHFKNNAKDTILELARIEGFQCDTLWIASRIGVPTFLVEKILAELLENKQLVKNADGNRVRPESATSKGEIDNNSPKSARMQNSICGKIRSPMILAVDGRDIPKVHQMVQDFLAKIQEFVNRDDVQPNSVCKIIVELDSITGKKGIFSTTQNSDI